MSKTDSIKLDMNIEMINGDEHEISIEFTYPRGQGVVVPAALSAQWGSMAQAATEELWKKGDASVLRAIEGDR